MNCMGGMLEERMITRIAWISGKLHNDGRFSTLGREKKRTGRRVTRHHATLGAGLVLDGPRLRGRERSDL